MVKCEKKGLKTAAVNSARWFIDNTVLGLGDNHPETEPLFEPERAKTSLT